MEMRMNFVHIEKIVRETLDGIPYAYTPATADHALVFMTFLAETDMFNKPHTEKNRFGMMAIHGPDLEEVIHDIIAPDDVMFNYIKNYTMVDVREYADDDIFLAAEYNIAFQVAVTYLFYLRKAGDRPETVTDAIRTYQEHWKGTCVDKSTDALGRLLGRYMRG